MKDRWRGVLFGLGVASLLRSFTLSDCLAPGRQLCEVWVVSFPKFPDPQVGDIFL